MGLLPEIEEGRVVERPEPGLFKPPAMTWYQQNVEEERLKELNNLGRREVTQDFSDSPHLN